MAETDEPDSPEKPHPVRMVPVIGEVGPGGVVTFYEKPDGFVPAPYSPPTEPADDAEAPHQP